MYKSYAGIGSRETPSDILGLMTEIAKYLDRNGFTLRSGGARGADTAFALGSTRSELFIPWQSFNGLLQLYPIPSEAYRIAKTIHPVWSVLSVQARHMMARNAQQILGPNLDNQSRFVICWTKCGMEKESERTRSSGGTAQAIAHADRLGIPIYNLCRPNRVMMFERYIK